MSTISEGVVAALQSVLFPRERDGAAAAAPSAATADTTTGQGTASRAELAARLREIADAIDSSSANDGVAVAGNGNALQPPASSRKASAALIRRSRDLDFSRYQIRRIALEVLYLGHEYQGFARQDATLNTVEEHLFAALIRTRLIPPGSTFETVDYTRGGRTDKGVSGLGQVVALRVRSSGKTGEPAVTEDCEYPYPVLLNAVLPPDIRILGWTTVPDDFNARFSANYREYKYFIVDDAGLDIDAMRTAAAHLVGEHDFRNFCKANVEAVKSFRRTIMEATLEEAEGMRWGHRRVIILYIRGSAFLWHQVRCIAALLLMVGRRHEDPDVVRSLLDIQATPAKPTYAMASDEPLLLFSCWYPGLEFRRETKAYKDVLHGLRAVLRSNLTRAAMVAEMEQRLERDMMALGMGEENDKGEKRILQREEPHVPLSKRPVETTIAERQKRLIAKLKAQGKEPPKWSDDV